MGQGSRINNSKLNAIFGIGSSLVNTILSFFTRTMFVYTLGLNYLGLNGLYTNILTMLSLAELGVSKAITFSLYKPIAENDQKKIKALMQLYKKAYQIIGTVIFALGLFLIPFLKYIVNFPSNVQINYLAIYLLFLMETVVSYVFFAYRGTIVYANQRDYELTGIETAFSVGRTIVQFIILLIFKNYYIYLIIPIMLGIIKNWVISKKAGKMYPIINEKTKEPLGKEERKNVFKNIYALSIFKISSVVYTSTDNVVISIFLGTTIVGKYSNYTLLIGMITSYINIIFNSVTAGIGNLNVTESEEYKYVVFKRLAFANYWIYGFCTLCLMGLINPFIEVWLGREYIFSTGTVFLICLMFFIPGYNNVINIFKDSCGLYWQTKYRALATAVVNVLSSILLVYFIGINGIFLGTIIAYLTTIYVIDPKVVFHTIFGKSSKIYYQDMVKRIINLIIIGLIMTGVNYFIKVEGYVSFIFRLCVDVILINGLFLLILRKEEEFKYFKEMLKEVCRKIFKRR